MQRYDEALANVEQAIALAPDGANYLDSKGEILAMSGRLQEAIPFFQRAVDLNPAFVNSYKNLVAIYNKLGRKAEAEEAERRVQELAAEQPG